MRYLAPIVVCLLVCIVGFVFGVLSQRDQTTKLLQSQRDAFFNLLQSYVLGADARDGGHVCIPVYVLNKWRKNGAA